MNDRKILKSMDVLNNAMSLLTICILSCQPNGSNAYKSAVINDSTYVELKIGDKNELICFTNDSLTSTWPLEYPVYQFQNGDINNDGVIDMAVGVIKSTRYDSVQRKRLFLYQIRNNSIIPLWLGSSVGHALIDFRVIQNTDNQNFIQIIGEEKTGDYLVANYEWYSFGLSLMDYVETSSFY